MATTTPNFGWSVPTSTDLVKDGATAIELLGDSIDTSFVDLLGGTTGQVLTKTSGTDLDFTFATPASGGKVLQVQSAVITTSTLIASTTFTDTAITLAITPTAATSKILVMISGNAESYRANTQQTVGAKLFRGATEILAFDNGFGESLFGIYVGSATEVNPTHTSSIVFLDSPNTTSATTYKLQSQCRFTTNSGSVTFQGGSNPSTITLIEIGA